MLYGAGSAVSVVLVLGILVLASLLADWQPLRWDVTREQTQSLSAVSKALLKEVTKPLTLTVFLPEGSGERQAAKEVLQLYSYNNPQVSFRFVDPEREPLKAQEAGYRFAGNVLLDYQGRRQMADQPDEERHHQRPAQGPEGGAPEGLFSHRPWRAGPQRPQTRGASKWPNRPWKTRATRWRPSTC